MDASPDFRTRCERIAAAIERNGIERNYWLEGAHCSFRFANSEIVGMVRFEFEGVVTTDAGDARTEKVDLDVRLVAETCGGVPARVEAWLADQVRRAIAVEFDRYIAAGHLTRPDFDQPPDDAGL